MRAHRMPEVMRSGRDGETVNLSERGIYFTSREKVNIGEPLEIFFTLPTELTGRSPEQVCCGRAWCTWINWADARS